MSAIAFTRLVIVINSNGTTKCNKLQWSWLNGTLDIKYPIWEALVLCSDCKKFEKHSPRQRIKSKLIVLIW